MGSEVRMGSGLDLFLAATPGYTADDLADTRLIQREVVANFLHCIPAAGIGGLDRLISIRMPLVVFRQRSRDRPTFGLGHFA